MGLSAREYEILNILLLQKEPVSVQTLAAKIGASPRTVRNDLQSLDKWARKRGFQIVRRPRYGVWLDGETGRFPELKQSAEQEKTDELFSPRERQREIMIELLLREEPVTIKELRSVLKVSDGTILSDLDQLVPWFAQQGLQLIRRRNWGIKVDGPEDRRRQAICDLLRNYANEQQLIGFLIGIRNPRVGEERLDPGTLVHLRKLMDLSQLATIEKIVRRAEDDLGFRFADGAYAGLTVHLAIAIQRIKTGKDVAIPVEQLAALSDKPEFSIAEKMARSLEEELGLSIPRSEIGFITLHLLGAKLRETGVPDEKAIDLELQSLARTLIEVAEGVLGLSLADDPQLVKGLALHLGPTVTRLRYGLTIKNPLLEEIREKYPQCFLAAQAAAVKLSEYAQQKVDEDEIAYIALHLGAALEREKVKKKPSTNKAVLVCSSGIGTTKLLASRMAQFFPEIEIVSILSAYEFEKHPPTDIQIAITTVPLDLHAPYPVVLVNPFLTADDLVHIQTAVGINRQNVKANPAFSLDLMVQQILSAASRCGEIHDPMRFADEIRSILRNTPVKFSVEEVSNCQTGLAEMLTPPMIRAKVDCADWQEAVYRAGEILTDRDIVTHEYVAEISKTLERHGPYMVVAPGVALLHADPRCGVNKLGFGLLTLTNGVCFGHPRFDPVDVVFIFASPDQEAHTRALREFKNLVLSKQVLCQIRNAPDVQTIRQIILATT